MAEKLPPPRRGDPVIAVIDRQTMTEVERLAEFYGLDVEEVLTELILLELEPVQEGETVH